MKRSNITSRSAEGCSAGPELARSYRLRGRAGANVTISLDSLSPIAPADTACGNSIKWT